MGNSWLTDISRLMGACYLCVAAGTAFGAPASVESRISAQNSLFEEYYQSELKAHPERATAYGDYRYDRLDDYSLAGIADQQARDQSFLTRLEAIPTAGLPEQDGLSHAVLRATLRQRMQNHAFKEYEMPVRFLIEKVPEQCQGIIAADPLLLPTQKFPSSISADDQQRLTRAITDAVNNEVLPAYRAFASFIVAEYAPHGRTVLSAASLPGGARRYLNDIHSRTTVSDLSPEQINQIGLQEIARIQAEMTGIAHKAGFADLAAFRASVESDPKYKPTSAEQIVEVFRQYVDQMQPKLPTLFTYIPGSPVTVEAMPAFQAANATHYQTGTPDGKRPGRIVVSVSNFAQRSLIDDEATAYHEGIPGHHMQLSVAQQMIGLPKFRQHTQNSGYIEGWALYAEQLGKEVGFYQDPVSDYGRLSSELFRAVRLVVDTGLHSEGWSRDQVVAFFRQSGAIDEPTIQSETDRYIAWPAQALSYKLGQLKFRELRARAEKQLGAKCDRRTFHDQMLNGGVLPLDLLDSRTNSWIKAQKLGAKTAAAN